MFPKGRQLRRNNCIFKALCAAIREFGIAALFISTESDRVRLYPPSFTDISHPYLYVGRRKISVFRCRSPPSDFDFASQLKIEIGGITHEENQSAGLLPVLYKGHSC